MRKSKAKSPYDFWGIECGAGWKSLYGPIINLAKKEGVRVSQVKEKFGALRIYVEGGSEKLKKAIMEAEAKSRVTCEKCGKPAELRSKNGWMSTVCDECNNIINARDKATKKT